MVTETMLLKGTVSICAHPGSLEGGKIIFNNCFYKHPNRNREMNT